MSQNRTRLAASRKGQDGASAVEFALVLMPLLVLVFGILQYGWYFYSSQLGASTAREAVRRVAVGDCPGDPELMTFVTSRLGSAATSAPTVTRAYTDANSVAIAGPTVGGKVTVTITFQSLDLNFPFIPVPDGAQIVRAVDARVEDTNSSGCA